MQAAAVFLWSWKWFSSTQGDRPCVWKSGVQEARWACALRFCLTCSQQVLPCMFATWQTSKTDHPGMGKVAFGACERTSWHDFSTAFSSIKRLAQGAAERVCFPHRRPVTNHNLKASKCNLGELLRCDAAEGSLRKTAATSAVGIILEWGGHSPAAWAWTECLWDRSWFC